MRMAEPSILYSSAGGVGTIVLNRPKEQNSLDAATGAAFIDAVAKAAADVQVRVVVLAANGPSFSAGGDFNWVLTWPQRSEREVPGPSLLLVERQGDERAQRQPERGDHGIRVHQREQQVPPQEIAPPVRLRVRGEHEREVGEEERPRSERHRQRRRSEARRERAERHDQGEAPERDVEPRERVPGVDAGPAQGGGADQVGPQVVAEREAGDSGHLERPAGQDLVGETDVEGRVRRDERIEQEVARRLLHAVPGVLSERQQQDEAEGGRKGSPERGRRGPFEWAAPEEPGGGDDQADGGREEEWGSLQAQPEGEGAEGCPERHHEARLDGDAQKALERDPRQQDREDGEKEEPGEGGERQKLDVCQGFTGAERAWYCLPLIE